MKSTTKDEPSLERDKRFMRRALALARRGLGKTSPNPAVGAVLVCGGRLIGEGWHKKAGGPHAEIEALRAAGIVASRKLPVASHQSPITTLYVTLEPCSTRGRTPPCTDAIIAAGVKRVVVGAVDPNPRHRGRGLKLLRRAGIRVESGVLAQEATRLNEAFNKWITTGMPLVIAKAAMSLDGKIATRTGDSRWITSDTARKCAHKLRAQVDAIMVGAQTVIRDDPQLTVRHGVRRAKQPWRVVVDARGRTPKSAKLFRDKHHGRTLVMTTTLSSARWRGYLAALGINVVVVAQKGGRVDLRAALRALGCMNVTSVLVEGGGELLGSAFDDGLVDKVALFYAPKVIGGRKAVPAVGGAGVAAVRSAGRFTRDARWRVIDGTTAVFEGSREIRRTR